MFHLDDVFIGLDVLGKNIEALKAKIARLQADNSVLEERLESAKADLVCATNLIGEMNLAALDAQHKNTQMQKEMDILSEMLWDRDTELDQLKAVTDPMVCDECNGVGEVPKGAKHFYEVDMKPCPICKIPRPSNQSQDMGKDDNKCVKCGNIAMPGGRHYCEMYNKGKDGAK